MFARAAIPRMVTLSTPTSPTMDLAAFKTRNRVRSLMRQPYTRGPTSLAARGQYLALPPSMDRFGEHRSLLRGHRVNNVHPDPSAAGAGMTMVNNVHRRREKK